jgi:hypothetical protein
MKNRQLLSTGGSPFYTYLVANGLSDGMDLLTELIQGRQMVFQVKQA